MGSFHPAATIARIDGRWPSLLPSCSKTGGENERLGAGAYRGSRCRLRHGISAVGPKIPYTKKRPLGPVPFTSRQTSSHSISGCSGALLPPSPPAEQATARQDQAGKSGTDDGTGDSSNRVNIQSYAPEIVGKGAISNEKVERSCCRKREGIEERRDRR